MEDLNADVLMDINWQMMKSLVKVYDNIMASIAHTMTSYYCMHIYRH